MSERTGLLKEISNTVQDYREGEIPQPSPDHIDRWVQQFNADVQIPMLRELDHVLKRTYLKREAVDTFLSNLVKNTKLAGDDPCAFWTNAYVMRIQTNGHSQKEMREIFGESLLKQCGLNLEKCGNAGGDYVYIDDVMFSGNRVGNDLEPWIANVAPANATVHIVVAALHSGGEYLVGKRLKNAIAASGKSIELKYWRIFSIENRNSYRNNSGVLWPVGEPEDAATKEYIALPHKFPLKFRVPGGQLGPFSGEEGRQLLERELLVAGVRIRGLSQHPKDILRPLGFSPFGVGFGSMIVTFRNCPNNSPLALWWGDPKATSGPFHWYPLFPRKTYPQAASEVPF